MPRVTITESALDPEYRNATDADRNTMDPYNNSLDYCRACFDEGRWEEDVPTVLLDTEWVEVDDEHPWYEFGSYHCEACGRPLESERDD